MLPKASRLTLKSDFENVHENGKFIAGRNLNVSFLDRKDSRPCRFGFIVSKKVSTKAHERNKIKRTLREIVRGNLASAKNGYDYVIIAKSGILKASRSTIESELMESLVK